MSIKEDAEQFEACLAQLGYVKPVRCKDCKYHFYEHDSIPYCANIDYGYGWRDEDYCSKAERKEE